jgi:hypothetical protein
LAAQSDCVNVGIQGCASGHASESGRGRGRGRGRVRGCGYEHGRWPGLRRCLP